MKLLIKMHKEKIKVEDKDVNEKYEDLKETLKSNSAYKAKLDEVGVNDDFLKSQVKKDLIVSKYKENFMKNIKINDNEIKTYYDNHKDEFTKEEDIGLGCAVLLETILEVDNMEMSC